MNKPVVFLGCFLLCLCAPLSHAAIGKVGVHGKQKSFPAKSYKLSENTSHRRGVKTKTVTVNSFGAVGNFLGNFHGREPVAIIHFPADKHYIHFAGKLRDKLSAANQPGKDEFYYIISVVPPAQKISKPVELARSPKANLRDVIAVMKQQRVRPKQMAVVNQASDGVKEQEIWIFKTMRSECSNLEKSLVKQAIQGDANI